MIDWPTPPAGGIGTTAVHLTLALPAAGDVWDRAVWDTATWDAYENTNFHDASCDVHGVTVDRGRQDPLGHAPPARAAFTLDNPTGVYSPWRTIDRDGIDLGAPVMGPSVPVRVATAEGPLFTGWVQTVTENDTGDDPDEVPTVEVTATDALTFLGQANGLEQAPAGAGELAGARLARIFANAALPAEVPVDLDAGATPLQSTTLARGALDEAWLTADTDGGVLWCTPAGVIRYVDVTALGTPEFQEPRAVFTDAANEGDGTLCPVSFTVTADRAPVKNVVTVARAGGSAVTVRDQPSIDRHGARPTQRLDLIHTADAWSTTVAGFMLERLAGADLQLSPLEGVPTDDAGWWAAAHDLDLGARVRVIRDRWGDRLDLVATVDGIAHRITLDGWTMTIRTSPGSQTIGYTRWDAGRWDQSVWDHPGG